MAPTVSTETLDPADEQAAPALSSRWLRLLLVTGAVTALLLLGAAVGLLFRLPGSAAGESPTAGSVDVGFAQDMATHHQQAVQMASWERDHTADPALRQLAFDIESSQTAQAGQMYGWLALWDQPAQPTGGYMAWMAGDAAGPGHSGHAGQAGSAGAVPAAGVARMPGMATDAELARLRSLSGRQLDVYFLQLMLRHHEGGTPMLRYALDHAGQPAVRTLAGSMLTSQLGEADYIRQLLAERGAGPLPAS